MADCTTGRLATNGTEGGRYDIALLHFLNEVINPVHLNALIVEYKETL